MLIDNIQDIDGTVDLDGDIALTGHILPDVTGGSGVVSLYDLGSATQKFRNIYADELFLGASSLYVNGKKVIEDVSDTMTFATDVNQAMVLNTSGIGGLTLQTVDAILKLQSTANEVNIDGAGGIEALVGATLPNKHMNFTNQSLGGNITFTSTGTNSNVQFNAADEITLTAPGITLTGTVSTDNVADLDSVVNGLTTHDHNDDYYTKTESNVYNSDRYTKAEVDSLHSAILSGIDWKEAVTNFADLATTYTSPVEGWTASVNSEDVVYRYDGSAWVTLANGTVPLATALLDGKLTASDFTKIQGIEAGANVNQTASELLTAIKTVDGGSSGLSAQYLNNVESSQFLRSDTNAVDTDANNYTTDGIYKSIGIITTNRPGSRSFIMLHVHAESLGTIHQQAYSYDGIHNRRRYNGVWTGWTSFLTTAGTAANSLKLNGYSPSNSAVGDTIVQRSPGGTIFNGYYHTTASDTTTNASHVYVETGTDGYIRPQPMSTFLNQITRLKAVDTRDSGDVKPNALTANTLNWTFTDEIVGSPHIWDGVLTAKGWSGNYAAWQLIGSASQAQTSNRFFMRAGNDATWGSLCELWHDKNCTYVSNTNGEYVRFENGVTIAWRSGSLSNAGWTTQTLPVTFTGVPKVIASSSSSATTTPVSIKIATQTSSSFAAACLYWPNGSYPSAYGGVQYNAIIIGKS